MLVACSAEKFVADDELMLKEVKVASSDANVKISELKAYIRQKPNSKWISSFKVPLGIYAMSGTDTTRWINRTLQKIGEPPVIIDSTLTMKTAADLRLAMQNKGFLDTDIAVESNVKGRKATLTYRVDPGEPYIIRGVKRNILDDNIAAILDADYKSSIEKGHIFSVNELNDERKNITAFLQDRGYYLFNKEFIQFDVDSSYIDKCIYITMHINQFRRNNNTPLTAHPQYRIRDIYYSAPAGETLGLRQGVLKHNTFLTKGMPYRASDLLSTYNRFSRLQAIKYTSIRFDEIEDSLLLDCHIQLSRQKPRSLQFMPEGTNTAGDFGVAASLTFQNRNLFHGSEVLNITARGAYEAINGLEGYNDNNYNEYGIEAGIAFPHFVFPWLSSDFRKRTTATTELKVSYNYQNRPEFHRRLFNAAVSYHWQNPQTKSSYKVDVLDLNYISMPWISETFKHDYIDSTSNRNAILRYNYENLFIMKFGFGYTWNGRGKTLRFNAESAGNLLNALARPLRMDKNDNGEYKFFKVAFAQYVKGDVDYTHSFQLDERNALVLHGRIGVAYPYGNSTILPFEKRYFSGGANSLRGWSVRSLGPGAYRGKDGRIDFINQTGDIRLDLNAELRTQLFWKFQGAIFVDAGNIWTIRNYDDQPGGQFLFHEFYKQLAANYGVGLRLNFDYFVLRFDMGVKAVNPAYTTDREHFPLLHPNFSRDVTLNFAVGMPF